jgi:hypothetical protein
LVAKDTERDERWFLRDFCKAPRFMLEDSTFHRLPFEVQGVWWALLLYSMTESKVPGWFLDRATGVPMRDDDIAYALAGSVDRIDQVKGALQTLRKAGDGEHLAFQPRDGWSIPRYADRFCTTPERRKVREADARRQRRRREKDQGGRVVHLDQGVGG